MSSVSLSPPPELFPATFLRSQHRHQPPCRFFLLNKPVSTHSSSLIFSAAQRPVLFSATSTILVKASQGQANGVYKVGDFMTKKEELHVVKPTTTVDQALVMLVENRITGFPVIDDGWKLVGLVSDYDLLALDSISGTGKTDADMFPEVDSSWKTFNEVQRLLSKTNGQVVGDLMTPAPVVVQESTNLEDAARILLETKYRRLPVVDGDGKLVGIITRGNVVRAALQIKRDTETQRDFHRRMETEREFGEPMWLLREIKLNIKCKREKVNANWI